MKNKKLFAILTLVCFMLTLMPVAAFAADATVSDAVKPVLETTVVGSGLTKVTFSNATNLKFYDATLSVDGKTYTTTGSAVYVVPASGIPVGDIPAAGRTFVAFNKNLTVPSISGIPANKVLKVEASDVSLTNIVADFADTAKVYTKNENASEKIDKNLTIRFDFDGKNSSNPVQVYVWFVRDGKNEPASGIKPVSGFSELTAMPGVYVGNAVEGNDYDFTFANNDKYKVYASLNNPALVSGTKAEKIRDVENKLGFVSNHQGFEITSSSSSSDFGAKVTVSNGSATITREDAGDQSDNWDGSIVGDGGKYKIKGVKANNVTDSEFTVKLVDAKGKAVSGQTVTLETNSANIELNKDKATTDTLGEIKFKIAGVRDGNYKIYVKAGSYEITLDVEVGATGAHDINCVKSPEAPIDITDDLGKKIQFTFTDANSNAVTTVEAAKTGAIGAFHSDSKSETINGQSGTDARPYVAVVSKPSASKLEDKNLKLVGASDNKYRANLTLVDADDLAEGTYEVKVVLDNGKYTTVKFEVKEFQTPVSLKLEYEADAVELDSYVAIDTLEWVDTNGVTKDASNKVDLAATGYAVEAFLTEPAHSVTVNGTSVSAGPTSSDRFAAGTVFTKNDDKYVGQKITVIAVDDRYNLTAQAELTVSDEASSLAFDTKTLAVNVNNKVGVSVVDSNGNKVALNRGMTNDATISYVVLDKPEGAKVSVTTDGSDNNILTEGTFKMNVTANTVGNVTIQTVAKVTYNKVVGNNDQQNVVKYYTGTQIFAVGKDSVGQVVVMSIGSSEVIVNDKKVAIDSVPMIKNDRTFVPFRALAEAFGAEVAYDEATQAITAELNGVKVVMTIGSATFTVNGTEKTMDVAPFINGSRTMVPVRFAAEAFGIKVIPTYDQNGATADILFNL